MAKSQQEAQDAATQQLVDAAAVAAAEAAVAAARVEAAAENPPALPQTTGAAVPGAPGTTEQIVVAAGDVSVICLKTALSVTMGNRHYSLVSGKEVLMDASHARELQQTDWVVSRGR